MTNNMTQDELNKIDTNLTLQELKEFWEAHDRGDTEYVEDSHSLYAWSREWQETWKGKTFTINEWSEVVTRTWREN